MSERRESCCSGSGGCGLPGRVDRVRDQEDEGSIGSFVYIECDQVRKCICLPPTPPSSFGPECTVPTPFCFPEDRQYVGGMEGEEERQREGRVICSGGNSTVK